MAGEVLGAELGVEGETLAVGLLPIGQIGDERGNEQRHRHRRGTEIDPQGGAAEPRVRIREARPSSRRGDRFHPGSPGRPRQPKDLTASLSSAHTPAAKKVKAGQASKCWRRVRSSPPRFCTSAAPGESDDETRSVGSRRATRNPPVSSTKPPCGKDGASRALAGYHSGERSCGSRPPAASPGAKETMKEIFN
jgi:hypothetical protein